MFRTLRFSPSGQSSTNCRRTRQVGRRGNTHTHAAARRSALTGTQPACHSRHIDGRSWPNASRDDERNQQISPAAPLQQNVQSQRSDPEELGREHRENAGTTRHPCICGWRDQSKEKSCQCESSVDKVDNDSSPVDCSAEEFRSTETALHQILNRTTANEPLIMIQEEQGQKKGFEAWHQIVRRYDQRNTSDHNSAHAAITSNISDRDAL